MDLCASAPFIKGGSIPDDWALYRRAVSYFGNRFLKAILRLPGVHDLTTGFRLTRVKGVLDQIDLDNLMVKERFAYKIDLLYKTIHFSRKTVEIPINFHRRTRETSKFSLMEIVATLNIVLRFGIKKVPTEGYKIRS